MNVYLMIMYRRQFCVRRAANLQNVRYFMSKGTDPYMNTEILYNWKALHLSLNTRTVVVLTSGEVSVNPRPHTVIIKRLILQIGRI